MYHFLLKFLSALTHPKRFFRTHSIVAFSRLSVKGEGQLNTRRTVIRKSSIYVEGDNNSVDLQEADIYNSTIRVLGTGNTLRIHNAVRVYNTIITIKKAKGGYIDIAERTHIGGGTIVCAGDDNFISFGKDCMIAEDVEIWSSDTHVITIEGKDTANSRPIVIGDHVWLGKGVTVLKGVAIGENAIVGMKSVVTHTIRPGTLNAGVPAKELKDGVSWHK